VRTAPFPLLGPSVLCAIAFAAALALGASAQTAHPSPEAATPLAPGRAVPSAGVRTVTGEPVDLTDLVRDEGALLVFYRGGW
jgi:hypothetical protein